MNVFVGSAIGGAAIPSPSIAKELPRTGPIGPADASPELTEAVKQLADASDVLEVAEEAMKNVWDLYSDWEKRNPRPGAPRAYRKWERRQDKHCDEIGLDAKRERREEAQKIFRKAQIAVANIRARDPRELVVKASVACVYEDCGKTHMRREQPIVSQSVALDACLLHMEGERA